jgi:hypothetical protein
LRNPAGVLREFEFFIVVIVGEFVGFFIITVREFEFFIVVIFYIVCVKFTKTLQGFSFKVAFKVAFKVFLIRTKLNCESLRVFVTGSRQRCDLKISKVFCEKPYF